MLVYVQALLLFSGLGLLDVDPITVPGAGFDLNSAMLDFDLSDPSRDTPGVSNADVNLLNRPGPAKRPLSLAVPVMIVPTGKRLCRPRVVTGSSNVGSVLQVLARKVFMGDPSRDAVEKSRLYLGETFGVPGYLKEPRDEFPGRTLNGPYPSVNIIVKVNDSISAYADSRSKGVK
jgi:gamma-glutamyltranspeptidase